MMYEILSSSGGKYKVIYSSIGHKYNFEILLLHITRYLILLLHYISEGKSLVFFFFSTTCLTTQFDSSILQFKILHSNVIV